MYKEYHVSKTGNDKSSGSKEAPFLTISKAASIAEETDTVVVHEGIYREWVKPKQGGYDASGRIVYQAAEGEKVEIKGSEVVKDWEKVESGIWKVTLSNTMFGDYNPYKSYVEGDWCFEPSDWQVHTGAIYVNGKSLYEVKSYEDLKKVANQEASEILVQDPEEVQYQWYTEGDDSETIIYGYLGTCDPREELVEINVRKCCFFPDKTGIDYITVSGFEMSQAATQWAPPTGEQVGIVGPNWSKGWIIENNIIHDAKCSGISIGKDRRTGDQMMYQRKNKTGYHYQLETVFTALEMGWKKERIGSHIIRNNEIYDCGQNGIVGNMGCVFSEIYENHIYRIGMKQEFAGFEIAAIKLHGAIDTQIYKNCIHDSIMGFWMDWQAQGTRISQNVFFDNEKDGFIEVTHGPMIIDNNIFGSKYALLNNAQGTAFVNNLFYGYQVKNKVLNRATPYHAPHSTWVKGCSCIYSGDDRYYNNIFFGGEEAEEGSFYGTVGYQGHLSSYEEYLEMVRAGVGSHFTYFNTEQPVYMADNGYLNGAKAFDGEEKKYEPDKACNLTFVKEERGVYLEIEMEHLSSLVGQMQDTKSLGKVRIADARFDGPEGQFISINSDFFGEKREEETMIGPFSKLKEGKNTFKVWTW